LHPRLQKWATFLLGKRTKRQHPRRVTTRTRIKTIRLKLPDRRRLQRRQVSGRLKRVCSLAGKRMRTRTRTRKRKRTGMVNPRAKRTTARLQTLKCHLHPPKWMSGGYSALHARTKTKIVRTK